MNNWPRVAFFSDSFHGVDGVATTCRNIVEFGAKAEAAFSGGPCGEKTSLFTGRACRSPRTRSQAHRLFNLDSHLKFDLLFHFTIKRVLEAAREFRRGQLCTSPVRGTLESQARASRYALGVAAGRLMAHESPRIRRPPPLRRWPRRCPSAQRSALTTFHGRICPCACLRFYQHRQCHAGAQHGTDEHSSQRHKKARLPHAPGNRHGAFSPAEARCPATVSFAWVLSAGSAPKKMCAFWRIWNAACASRDS